MDAAICNRVSDRYRGRHLLRRSHRKTAGERRVFGRAVTIDKNQSRIGFQNGFDPLWREHVTTGQQVAHRAENAWRVLGYVMEQRCCEPKRRYILTVQDIAQLLNGQLLLLRHDQGPAIQQWPPDFQGGCIKRHRGIHKEPGILVQIHEVVIEHQAEDIPIGNFYPFRQTGRA